MITIEQKIKAVEPDSPADTADLQAGDTITQINHTPIENPEEIADFLRFSLRYISTETCFVYFGVGSRSHFFP